MPYTPDRPTVTETPDQLRARIPGWGADLDPRDRPSVPRERFDPGATGAHWHFPERQPENRPRERSIEHAFLTPVFGTTAPMRGLSGVVRRYAYTKGEGRADRWLLLLAADRVDVAESRVRALLAGRPDNPVTETGVLSELSHHGLRSRFGRGRADAGHHALDPVLVAARWAVAAGVVRAGARVLSRRRRAPRSAG